MSDQTVINAGPKPGKVQVMEVMLLVSGILNILSGLAATCGAIASIIGIVCFPVAVLPLVLGVFEVVYASKLLREQPVKAGDIKTIAIFEIASILAGNVPCMIVGILNLVFLEERQVKEYFA